MPGTNSRDPGSFNVPGALLYILPYHVNTCDACHGRAETPDRGSNLEDGGAVFRLCRTEGCGH